MQPNFADPTSAPAAQPVPVQVVSERPYYGPPPPPPRPGFFRRLFSRGVTIALMISLFANLSMYTMFHSYFQSGTTLEEKFHSGDWRAMDKIAIITVDGPILDGEGFVKSQIDQVRDDSSVKAVVVRVDSPGGSVTASDQLYHELRKLREERKLPMVVSMGGIAASGGYYVAMAVGDEPNSIYAEPTTWTGSIGVIIPHYNVADLMKEWHVVNDSIKSHPLKDLGSFTKEMTADERAILQGLVDDSFVRFKDVIKTGRPKYRANPAELDQLATGQVYTSKQALANGLVDREGFLADALGRAAELGNTQVSSVRVVKYERLMSLTDVLTGQSAAAPGYEGLANLIDMSTPRAFYMASWLPPVATSASK
jgi:protease-4